MWKVIRQGAIISGTQGIYGFGGARSFENQARMASSLTNQTKNPAPSNFDDYVDLLDELRSSYDLTYALRQKNFPQYRGVYSLATDRSPAQLMDNTLKSSRVQATIDAVSSERNWTRETTEKAAKMIAAEMAHNFDMKTVRSLAYVAKKVIPQLFSNVYVNRSRFEQLRDLSTKSAIIFMPSHRTYMDFILLQFLCFHYEIKLPAIASAIDFLNMKFMGEVLRRCGAFFIRRKFGGDQLYWAIFIEYVENQLKHADRPLEFFIEGTRSRTGKSLHPKYGLLSVLLEPYFRNELFDFHVVPISVSFSRFLEENLYAYELLGFPKPKESTSGLWKARSVLEIDFGDVYVHAGEPISVRDYFTSLERPLAAIGEKNKGNQPINRSVHALRPAYMFDFTPQEQSEIRRLGHRVVKINERHAVVRIWPLICIILGKMQRRSPISISELSVAEFENWMGRFFDLVRRLNYHIPLKSGSLKDEIKYALELHSNIIDRDGDRLRLKPVAVSVIDTGSAIIPGKVIDAAVPRLMVSNYANQAMHLFADLAFVCLSILKNGDQCDRRSMFNDFAFLQEVFGREFISIPGEEEPSFEDALRRLVNAGILDPVTFEKSIITINNSKSEEIYSKIYEIASVIESFLRGYFLCCQVWTRHHDQDGQGEKKFVIQAQKSIADLLVDGQESSYELLSGDMIKNCLHSLSVLKAVKKTHQEGTKFIVVDSEIAKIQSKLGGFVAALDEDWRKSSGNLGGRKAKL